LFLNYQYDTRGNRIQTAGITLDETDFIPGEFTYNNWEELTSFAIDGGSTYTYQYDAEGLRTYKTGPGSTTKYHYDLSGRVIAESNGAGNVTAQNIWGHKMLARKIGAAYYYYLYNGHGDVVQVIDESGNIKNSYTYDEWGNLRSISETIENPLRYCGEYFDEESGLYYLRARYYDPLIARFITKDSLEGDISNPLSMNQYTYCYNNPLIYADPSGHYVDYASEAARMNIAQTGAWKDTVDQRLTDIGNKYMGGITDLDRIVSILQTVPTTTNGNYSTSEAVTSQPSPSSSTNPDKVSSAAQPTSAGKEDANAGAIILPQNTYSINPFYGSMYLRDTRSDFQILANNPLLIIDAARETLSREQNRYEATRFVAESAAGILVVNTALDYCYDSFSVIGRSAGQSWPTQYVEMLKTIGIGVAVLATYDLIANTRNTIQSYAINLRNHILKAREF